MIDEYIILMSHLYFKKFFQTRPHSDQTQTRPHSDHLRPDLIQTKPRPDLTQTKPRPDQLRPHLE